MIIELNSTLNRAGSKPALNDIEMAQAPGASRARWFGSSVSAARFQNHFPDAPPSASGEKKHGGEK